MIMYKDFNYLIFYKQQFYHIEFILICNIFNTYHLDHMILLDIQRHFLFKYKKDINGILSYHLIIHLHCGQNERSNTTPLSCGSLNIQTFEKLPQMAPKIKKKAKITN